MDSLKENNVLRLMTLLECKNAMSGRWIKKIKEYSEGSPKYKAKFVARGWRDLNYTETFSLTADITTRYIQIQMAAQYDLVLQMDVKTAYLQGLSITKSA